MEFETPATGWLVGRTSHGVHGENLKAGGKSDFCKGDDFHHGDTEEKEVGGKHSVIPDRTIVPFLILLPP